MVRQEIWVTNIDGKKNFRTSLVFFCLNVLVRTFFVRVCVCVSVCWRSPGWSLSPYGDEGRRKERETDWVTQYRWGYHFTPLLSWCLLILLVLRWKLPVTHFRWKWKKYIFDIETELKTFRWSSFFKNVKFEHFVTWDLETMSVDCIVVEFVWNANALSLKYYHATLCFKGHSKCFLLHTKKFQCKRTTRETVKQFHWCYELYVAFDIFIFTCLSVDVINRFYGRIL